MWANNFQIQLTASIRNSDIFLDIRHEKLTVSRDSDFSYAIFKKNAHLTIPRSLEKLDNMAINIFAMLFSCQLTKLAKTSIITDGTFG